MSDQDHTASPPDRHLEVRSEEPGMVTREGPVNRRERQGEAALEERVSGDTPAFLSQRRRSDDEVTRLIGRIRKLVDEQRRLKRSPESQRREATSREIARLQLRLAAVVKSRLPS